MPQSVINLRSHEGYLPEYLPSRSTVLLAPGHYGLKSSLLASYNGDIFIAKRLHRRLSQPLPLYSYYTEEVGHA